MRSFVVSLVIVFLLLVLSSGVVFAEMTDVVYLKNGSIIKGMIIETIPNESIKIETADGSIFVYSMDEVQKMTKEKTVGKKPKQPIKLKSRSTATILAVATGFFSLGGSGQIYNGEYVKGLGVLVVQFGSAVILTGGGEDFWVLPFFASYAYGIYDANVSAKRINEARLQEYEEKEISTSLNYIPHQGLMASYSMRF